ncbi:MAG: hypothetical protein ACOZB0_12460 [Pseudomonadota bacterium]
MHFPEFFHQVPPLRLVDPLSVLLGATDDGLLEYRYPDAVRWAGHSCPTVAGAWLMTRTALSRLYPEGRPERGQILVDLRDPAEFANAGVVGGVIGFITGAAGTGGFAGLGGRFVRRDLMRYGVEQAAEVRFTRRDTGATLGLEYRPAVVPPDPALPPLMQKLLAGQAEREARAAFARLWQDRVRRLLIEHADDPELVRIHP